MYKNQLQELAQRSCFSLPAYTCIREGPDHAPRFKATVSFNGEVFESPSYCTTLRQAEHSAAEVALNSLSTRGPSPSLAAKILDETGIGKNLLQETAQRAGLSLPVYTTIRAGPGHLPVFKCIVKVAERVFAGEPAKTKKQAEKNAAMVALSAIKQLLAGTQPLMITDSKAASDERDQSLNGHSNALTLYRGGDRSAHKPSSHAASRNHGGRPRVRVVNVRERNACYETGRGISPGQPNAEHFRSDMMHPRNHSSLFGMDSRRVGTHEPLGTSMNHRALPHQQEGPSRLSLQSCSDRLELRRSLLEEIQSFQLEGDEEWLSATDTMQQPPSLSRMNTRLDNRRSLFQSQSERFELKPSLLDELYHREEEDWWLRGEVTTQPMPMFERASSSSMHRDREMGSYMYYGGNMGLSHSSGYTNNTNNDCISYGSGAYNDGNAIITYASGEEFGQKGSYISGSREAPKLRSPSYSSLNVTPERVSHSNNNGYNPAGFTLDASQGVFYQNEDGNSAFRGYANTSDINNVVSKDEGTFAWTHSPPQSMMCRLPVTAQPFGMHSASSLAPPVRVRHMVAVCSAPPRRTDIVTTSITNSEGNDRVCHQSTPDMLLETSSSSTSQLFSQLRL